MGKHNASTGHDSGNQHGGTDRGKVREARDDRTAKEAAAHDARIARDSFAVEGNRPKR